MPGEIRDFQAETPSSSIGEEHKSFSESDTDSQILMGHYIEQLVGKHSTAWETNISLENGNSTCKMFVSFEFDF